jgi:hypothetical protein
MTPGHPFDGDMQHCSVPLNQRSFGCRPSSSGPEETSYTVSSSSKEATKQVVSTVAGGVVGLGGPDAHPLPELVEGAVPELAVLIELPELAVLLEVPGVAVLLELPELAALLGPPELAVPIALLRPELLLPPLPPGVESLLPRPC